MPIVVKKISHTKTAATITAHKLINRVRSVTEMVLLRFGFWLRPRCCVFAHSKAQLSTGFTEV